MNERNDDRFDDIVDQQLRHLRGEGLPPDLSALTDDELAEVLKMLEIVDALADSLPASPLLTEDPVAIRLGLVDPPTSGEAADDPVVDDDPVWSSSCELAARFGAAAVQVELPEDSMPGPGGRSVRVMCRSLAEVVSVVVFDELEALPTAADANEWLRQRPQLSAVAFTSGDAARASVVTAAQAAPFLVPGVGWQTPGDLSWEPLGMALARHFERSTPQWNEVIALPAGDLLDDLAIEATAVARVVLDEIATTRPILDHKQHARDFVTGIDAETIVAWIEGVRTRELTGDDVIARVSETCRAVS